MKVGYLNANLGYTIEMENKFTRDLEKNQCDRIVVEIGQQNEKRNSELEELLKTMKGGDQLVVIKMNHLAYSIKEIFRYIALLKEKGIHV